MFVTSKPPAFTVDNNGDYLIRCECSECHEIFYDTDEVITEITDKFHKPICSSCINGEHIQQLESGETDNADPSRLF